MLAKVRWSYHTIQGMVFFFLLACLQSDLRSAVTRCLAMGFGWVHASVSATGVRRIKRVPVWSQLPGGVLVCMAPIVNGCVDCCQQASKGVDQVLSMPATLGVGAGCE